MPLGPTSQIAADLQGLAVPLEQLDPLPGNPRRGDVEAVARSYARFGQRKPIVARRQPDGRGTVISGNHQLAAAKVLGWTELAVVWVDDDDATANAFALADNRVSDLGSYDDELLAAALGLVADADLLAATGYTEADLAELLAHTATEPPVRGDPDHVPARPPARTVPGDVWLLGPHRVICGDCTEPTVVEALMEGELADACWTDPPYGVSVVGGSRMLSEDDRRAAGGQEIANDDLEGLPDLLAGALDSVVAACRPGAPVYVAAPSGPNGTPFAVALLERDLFRQKLVWVKDSLVLGHSDYHYRHEDIYFGYTAGAKGRRGRGGDGWYGDNSQTSVLEFARPKASREHPTMKPVDLIAYCLGNSTRRTDLVFDPFAGSGSTLIAAHQHGRRARLIELDPGYVDVICRRWQEATGIEPVARSTGRAHDFTQE